MTKVEHTLEPVFDPNSKTLILGSMPSVTSREILKYYGHKSNRFWTIMETIYEEKIEDWKEFILKHHLALWDVIAECDIESSKDSSIKDVKVNDIAGLIKMTNIENVFLLGRSAYDLYNRYLSKEIGIKGVYLPSPSSANAAFSLEKLVEEYTKIKEVTE